MQSCSGDERANPPGWKEMTTETSDKYDEREIAFEVTEFAGSELVPSCVHTTHRIHALSLLGLKPRRP